MDEEQSFNSEMDANTLISAAEIRMDPERLAAAMSELNKQKKVISSIDDLKAKANEMDEEEPDEEEQD